MLMATTVALLAPTTSKPGLDRQAGANSKRTSCSSSPAHYISSACSVHLSDRYRSMIREIGSDFLYDACPRLACETPASEPRIPSPDGDCFSKSVTDQCQL